MPTLLIELYGFGVSLGVLIPVVNTCLDFPRGCPTHFLCVQLFVASVQLHPACYLSHKHSFSKLMNAGILEAFVSEMSLSVYGTLGGYRISSLGTYFIST